MPRAGYTNVVATIFDLTLVAALTPFVLFEGVVGWLCSALVTAPPMALAGYASAAGYGGRWPLPLALAWTALQVGYGGFHGNKETWGVGYALAAPFAGGMGWVFGHWLRTE